jgi:pimeloyl-ACP methyl ester carboxylesterase
MFPGINGREWFGDAYRGLRDGGVEAAIRVHDWSGAELASNLSDHSRNRAAAAAIAADLAVYRAEHPHNPIDFVGYSGGGGLAIMVLEALPPDVRIRNVILAQPAVSCDYHLSPALQHVDGRMVNFYCPSDWVILGAGTTVFGTIDRKHAASAGKQGFDLQAAVPDDRLRGVVQQYPWSWDMFWTGHAGGHMGICRRGWNRRYVAPFLAPAADSQS